MTRPRTALALTLAAQGLTSTEIAARPRRGLRVEEHDVIGAADPPGPE